MPTATTQSTPPPPGLLDALRSFLGTWVAVIKTRVDIISTEIEEQRAWMEHIIFLAIASMFCLSLGLVILTLFVVMCFWESYRLWVLGIFAVLYLGGGLTLALKLKNRMKSRPRIFSSTSEELAKDYSKLQPHAP
jgi:uncharacterized membrane protein YqjE